MVDQTLAPGPWGQTLFELAENIAGHFTRADRHAILDDLRARLAKDPT